MNQIEICASDIVDAAIMYKIANKYKNHQP